MLRLTSVAVCRKRQMNNVRVDEIMRYARICRVANVMRPYLEAVL